MYVDQHRLVLTSSSWCHRGGRVSSEGVIVVSSAAGWCWCCGECVETSGSFLLSTFSFLDNADREKGHFEILSSEVLSIVYLD